MERLASGKLFYSNIFFSQSLCWYKEIILRDNLVRLAARKVCLMFLQNLAKRIHLIYIVKLLENRHLTHQLAHPSPGLTHPGKFVWIHTCYGKIYMYIQRWKCKWRKPTIWHLDCATWIKSLEINCLKECWCNTSICNIVMKNVKQINCDLHCLLTFFFPLLYQELCVKIKMNK